MNDSGAVAPRKRQPSTGSSSYSFLCSRRIQAASQTARFAVRGTKAADALGNRGCVTKRVATPVRGEKRFADLSPRDVYTWRLTVPERHRNEATQALRQVLNRAVARRLSVGFGCRMM